MEWIAYVVATLFSLLGAGCLVLVVFGLPGTWVMLGLAVLVEVFGGYYLAEASTFGGWVLGGCTLLALTGEGLELLTGAAGTKLGGGTRRGMIGAMLGGFLGAIVFTPLIPIPVLGTLVGALVGTFCGALAAERTRIDRPEGEQADLKVELKAATGATIGRLLGTTAKAAIAVTLWIGLSVAAFWP